MGIIYGLKCPIKKEIRYVGQTVQKPKSRLKRHIWESIRKKQGLTHKDHWLKLLHNSQKTDEIEIVILETCDLNKIDDREIYWIKKLRKTCDLTNTAEGGHSCRLRKENHPNWGKKLSEDTKQKIRETKIGEKNPNWGKTSVMPQSTKDKISKVLLKSKKLKESRASQEYKNKISDFFSEPIVLVSTEDNSIKREYKNCVVASKDLGCTSAAIKNARRNGTPIGKRIKSLEVTCFVFFKKDMQGAWIFS